MGNVIIKVSHVGMVASVSGSYQLPATEEEMLIAKRAAERTRARWADDRMGAENVTRKSDTGTPQRGKKTSRSKKIKTSQGVAKRLPLEPSISEQAPEPETEKDKSGLSLAAKKLGVSEEELQRRIAALKRWRSEDCS